MNGQIQPLDYDRKINRHSSAALFTCIIGLSIAGLAMSLPFSPPTPSLRPFRHTSLLLCAIALVATLWCIRSRHIPQTTSWGILLLFNFALNIGALASSAWFLVKTPSGDDRNQCVFYLSGALRRIEVYRSVNDSLPADLADLVQWERSIDNFTSSNATDRYLIPSSCRYDGGRKVYFEGRRVILHDDIMAHREKGIHVVFADGSIEWLEAERTVQFMRAVASP